MEITNICEIISMLRTAPRIGSDTDFPEGSRVIQISDTLANEISTYLENKHTMKIKSFCDVCNDKSPECQCENDE